MIYGKLGQNLYREGRLTILGGSTAIYSLVYPALVGIPLSIGDLALGYSLLKGLQAVVASLVAVPVYLWGRTLMAPRWALVAAALALALPGLAFAGLIMSEVAFMPTFALAAWATAAALARPTLRNQGLLVAAINLAAATRLQALVLLPVLVTALLVKALFDRRLSPALRLAPALGALALLGAGWSAWRLSGGGSGRQLLGAYSAVSSPYTGADAARWTLYHAGDLVLMTGVVPVCALLLLALTAAAGREESTDVKAFLAVTLSLVLWVVAEVGYFAAANVGGLGERYLLGLAPILFLALALWLDRGAPRPFVRAGLVAVVVLLLVFSLPLHGLIEPQSLHNILTLDPVLKHVSPHHYSLVVFGGATALAAAFVVLPRRALPLTAVAVFAALAAASVSASRIVADEARAQQTRLVGPERRWVDARTDAPVAYLYDGDPYWNGVWEHVFWNRRIDVVYDVVGRDIPGPLPEPRVAIRPDGRLARSDGGRVRERYAVASTSFTFEGERLATAQQQGVDQAGLAVWRLHAPLRVSTWTTGRHANGDILGSPARLTAYGCGHGTFHVILLGKAPADVTIKRDGETVRRLHFTGSEVWDGRILSRPRGRSVCTFEVASTDLVGSTYFEFLRR